MRGKKAGSPAKNMNAVIQYAIVTKVIVNVKILAVVQIKGKFLNYSTYKCMSIPLHSYKCCQNFNAKCSILQQNMQCHINKSYFLTSLKYLKLD